jgi:hypothetical protein
MDPVASLRAEVERLREEADAAHKRIADAEAHCAAMTLIGGGHVPGCPGDRADMSLCSCGWRESPEVKKFLARAEKEQAVIAAARLDHKRCPRKARPAEGFLGACNVCAHLAALDTQEPMDG